MCGDGTELNNVKNYAREKSVAEYFSFIGRLSDQKMLEALNQEIIIPIRSMDHKSEGAGIIKCFRDLRRFGRLPRYRTNDPQHKGCPHHPHQR